MKIQMASVAELADFRPLEKKYRHEEVIQGLQKKDNSLKMELYEQFNNFTHYIMLSTVIPPSEGVVLILHPKPLYKKLNAGTYGFYGISVDCSLLLWVFFPFTYQHIPVYLVWRCPGVTNSSDSWNSQVSQLIAAIWTQAWSNKGTTIHELKKCSDCL